MAASLTPAVIGVRAAPVAPVTVLLVDDQPARLLAYRVVLEPLGEHLLEARSGIEALTALMGGECAVILLDVNMPGMDGFETASLIHQHPRFEKTPIIFVTAVNISDLDRIRGYKLGAVDYVTVPIIPEILRSKVAALCELHRTRLDLQFANSRLATANEALRVEKARELAVLNESLRVANGALASRNIELQTQVAERERAEARLLELGRRKDEFLATLAHELRNPLAALSNAINSLRLAGDGDGILHRTMERQLRLLVRLIDDLLDTARISHGKLTLEFAPTSLKAVLESAVESITPLLVDGGRRLEIDVPPERIDLHADRERLLQVFSNLLGNAVKYSDPGEPITLAASCTEDLATVAVQDRGIGLTGDQITRIFEPFTQVAASERSRGGIGIGLTLARQIVEMHGGTIHASSAGLGHGSRFEVRLPLRAQAAETPAAIAGDAREPVREEPRRVLIVDDNQDSADTLAMMLQLLGHATRCIYDPRLSCGAATEFAPDIAFLDLGMPGLDGCEVARALRAQPDGARLTLVALTGWGQPEERRRTSEAGFDHHLVKPVDMAVIRRICAECPRIAASQPSGGPVIR